MFSIPSAPQKRFIANGKSRETQTTVVFSRLLASLLKRRTLSAQVPVSMLGKMLRTTFFPLRQPSESSERSRLVKPSAGAAVPVAGRSLLVLQGVPLNVN